MPRTSSAAVSTQEKFEKAVNVIRSLPQDGAFKPSDMVKLKFYALYKQARQGPNKTAKPGFWDPTGRAKWEAWNMCGNMTQEAAMKMYVEELQLMVETMPQTPEVEEFLRAIGPFYDIVNEGDKDAEGKHDESDRLEDTESGSEEEFHDSMTETQHPVPAEPPPPHADEDLLNSSFSSPLVPSLGLTTPSYANTSPNSSHPVACTPHSHEVSPSTTVRKGVHFADEATPGLAPSLVELPSETMLQLQHNLQMMTEQLGQMSSLLRSLQEQSAQENIRVPAEQGGRASGSMERTLSLAVVCPLAVSILLSYLIRRSGSVSVPWWVWGVVTCLHVLSSLVLVLARLW